MKLTLQKNITLAHRLWLNAAFIVVIFGGLGLFASNSIKNITESANNLYLHPYTVSNAVRSIQYHVLNINIHMKNIVLRSNIDNINQRTLSVLQSEKHINSTIFIVDREYLGDKSDIKIIRTLFKQWSVSRSRIALLARQGFHQQATELSLSDDDTYVSKIDARLQNILDFSNKKALEFVSNSQQEQIDLLQALWLIIASLTVFTLASSWFLINHIAPPINDISTAISHLAKGNINFKWKPSKRNDEIGSIEKSLYDLKTATIYMSNHARNISKGYYNLEIKARSEHDVLGQSMATMSEHLKSTALINEGMIGLNNVIIGDQNINELAKNILHHFCQVTQSQVGCFYLVNNDTINCISTYAFPFGSIEQQPFPIGEGIVGEAALQMKTLSYTDLTNDYFKIESAVGSMPLTVSQVIPIIHNDKVIVLFEFGRTHKMDEIYHHLFKTASVTITSTIQTALNHKNNDINEQTL